MVSGLESAEREPFFLCTKGWHNTLPLSSLSGGCCATDEREKGGERAVPFTRSRKFQIRE